MDMTPIYYENMSQITKPFALVHASEAELGLLIFMLMDSLVFRHLIYHYMATPPPLCNRHIFVPDIHLCGFCSGKIN